LEQLDFPDFLVQLVKRGHVVQLAITVERDAKDLWALRDHGVREENLAIRDFGVHEGSRVQVVPRDQKETMVCQELRVHKETRAPKVHQGPWVSVDH